ncbi:MAG TPA: carbohydrate ABC transporter permease [Chloroflexota bacterium]|nr:carbohydrate ABC transporter permease [Chloroflexota bacterium]
MGILNDSPAPARTTTAAIPRLAVLRVRISWGMALFYAALVVGAVLFLVPFLWMILASFKTAQEIVQVPPMLWPVHPTLANYGTVLSMMPLGTFYRNSLTVTTSVTLSVLFTSSLAGDIFAKFQFFGRNVLFVLILSTLMIPFQVVLIPTYMIVNALGLLNTLGALIVPSLVNVFGIFLMRQYIENLPSEYIDAARIDGASEWGIYSRVILPQIRPALAALAIFTFMASWNDYLWPLIVINDQDKMTLPLALAFFNSAHGIRYDLTLTAATLVVIPVVIVFLILQRQFIQGIALTGLKA